MSDSFQRGREFSRPEYLIGANVKIDVGDMVAIATTGGNAGYLVPVTLTTGLKIKGQAISAYDNTGGAVGAGKVAVELSFGPKGLRVYKVLTVAAPDNVTQVDVGSDVYGFDAKYVTTDNTGASIVGEVFRIDTDGHPFVIFNQ